MSEHMTRTSPGIHIPAVVYAGLALVAALLASVAVLGASHALALRDPIVIVFALLLAIPALVSMVAPAVALGLVLSVALISWAVPAVIPQLSSLGPETTYGITVLTAWIGLLVRAFQRRERLSATPLILPLALCCVWAVISFVANRNALGGHSTLFTGFLLLDAAFFLYAANAVRTERALRGVLLSIVFASIPVSVIAYLQYTWLYLGVSYKGVHPALEVLASNVTYDVRMAATLSDAGIASYYYLVVMVLGVGLVVVERSRWVRVALLVTIAFDIWPFLVTFTKSSLVVVVLALLALAWMRRSWRMAASSVLVSAVAWAALTFIPFSASLANLGVNAVQYGVKSQGDLALRSQAILSCLKNVPKHPLFGAGPLGSIPVIGTHCHSLVPELLLDYGVIGTLLFGWLLWRALKPSWRARKVQSPFLLVTAQMNLALLLAFAVLSFLWPLINFALPWWWCLIAIVAGGSLFRMEPAAGPAVLAAAGNAADSASDAVRGSDTPAGAGFVHSQPLAQ